MQIIVCNTDMLTAPVNSHLESNHNAITRRLVLSLIKRQSSW